MFVAAPRKRSKRRFELPSEWAPTPLPSWHGLLIPAIERTFRDLGVGVSVWTSAAWWHPIHEVPSITGFEDEYGVAARRHAHNHRCLTLAASKHRSVRAEHAGFTDLFVPLADARALRGVLVAGPVATSRPASASVLRRWLDVTGLPGRVTDPNFSRYLTATLSTLTLDRSQLDAFEQLLSCFGHAMLGDADATDLGREVVALRPRLSEARFAERMWKTARSMLDAPSVEAWAVHAYGELAALDLARFPEQVVGALLVGRRDEADPVDEVLRRDAFLHASVALARRRGRTVCHRVGDHGVAFLCTHTGSATRIRSRLGDLAVAASSLARRFGLKLHAGIGPLSGPLPLRERYRAALSAADKALSQGLDVVFAEPRREHTLGRLRELRMELGKSSADPSPLLGARFDRYVEAVLDHSGFGLESTRAHLEAGLDRLTDAIVACGVLDAKSQEELAAGAAQAAADAHTVREVVDSYRRAVADVELAAKRPTGARQERSTGRALQFIREHVSEPLTLRQVASAAGFAPNYFGTLFQRSQGVTFSRYVRRARIERAKHLLSATELSVEQIQRLSGFQTRTHFHRAFREDTGVTPASYRER
jgi:AraC-like DNA-binding protein